MSDMTLIPSGFGGAAAIDGSIMSVMSSGKLTQQQVDIAQRIAVKVLAVLGIQESNKKQEKEE